MSEQATKSGQSAPRKRIYLINRDFQLRYTWAAVVVGLASTILTSFVILFPLYSFEILRIPMFLPIPILGVMGLAALVNITMVGLFGVILTHKIAGPMYSLVRHFRRIEEGQWVGQDMRLREGDELRYVVRNFNSMLASVRKALEEDIEILENIKKSAGDAEKADVIRESVAQLEERINQRLEAEIAK